MCSLLDAEGWVLFDLMGPRNVRRLRGGVPVWRIGPPTFLGISLGVGAGFESKRRELLARIIMEFQGAYLTYEENPLEDGLKGVWERVARRRNVWRVPADADPIEVFHWLYLGEWTIFVSPDPSFGKYVWRVLESGKPEDILSAMEEASVKFLLVAGYDNDEWIVAVATGSGDMILNTKERS